MWHGKKLNQHTQSLLNSPDIAFILDKRRSYIYILHIIHTAYKKKHTTKISVCRE